MKPDGPRNRLLLVAGLALVGLPLAAQRRPVAVDLVVGGGAARFSTAQPGRETPFGWALGVEASQPLDAALELVTGLSLVQRGDRARLTGTDIEGRPVAYRSTTSLRYLSVPVMLRASLGGTFRPQFSIGPEAAFQVGCQLRETLLPAEGSGGSIPCWDGLQDVAQLKVHRFDLGVVAGVGASFRHLGLEVRYTHGLRGVYPLSPGGTVQNRSIGILARVRVRGS